MSGTKVGNYLNILNSIGNWLDGCACFVEFGTINSNKRRKFRKGNSDQINPIESDIERCEWCVYVCALRIFESEDYRKHVNELVPCLFPFVIFHLVLACN